MANEALGTCDAQSSHVQVERRGIVASPFAGAPTNHYAELTSIGSGHGFIRKKVRLP